MLGDQLDLRIMVELTRVLCDLDVPDDFDVEEFLLGDAARTSLAAAEKKLVGALTAAETNYRSEFVCRARSAFPSTPFRTSQPPRDSTGGVDCFYRSRVGNTMGR